MNRLIPLDGNNWKKSLRLIIFSSLILIIALFVGIYYTDLILLEKYGHLLSNRVIWASDTSLKRIAITFDDGPNEEYTPKLLDILSNYDAKATFFLIGKNVSEEPDIARRIHAEGHEIGNHTYSHPVLPLVSRKEVHKQLESTNSIIKDAVGTKPVYFRPPMGLFTPAILDIIESNGLQTVIGEVYPRDPNRPGKDKIIKRVLTRVKPGSIIIMHDGGTWGNFDRNQTIEAVPIIIEKLQAKGYRFVTLSELISGDEKIAAN